MRLIIAHLYLERASDESGADPALSWHPLSRVPVTCGAGVKGEILDDVELRDNEDLRHVLGEGPRARDPLISEGFGLRSGPVLDWVHG